MKKIYEKNQMKFISYYFKNLLLKKVCEYACLRTYLSLLLIFQPKKASASP
jgi:hypothetical protein